MRRLNPEEAELWARVTATIRPLSRRSETDGRHPEPIELKPRPVVQSRKPLAAMPLLRPGTTLDGSWDRKLQSGSAVPDRVLDLHGLSLDRAWNSIDLALERAIDAGDRVLLLITGHERPGNLPVRRGQIRAAVHDWLAVSRHASHIAAVRAAHGRHGGGGSLYIVLRRR